MKLSLKDDKARLIRWQIWFANYRIKFEYISGKSNFVADFLSRHFAEELQDNGGQEGNWKSLLMLQV